MAASCSAGKINEAGGELVSTVKAGCRLITLDLDLPSVAIPNISFNVLTSEKFREHHIWLKKCQVPDEMYSIRLIFIVTCCFALLDNKYILI